MFQEPPLDFGVVLARCLVGLGDLSRPFDNRTYLSDTAVMRGNEFIRRVQKYARTRGFPCEWHPEMGKGSHGVLILGDRRTVVRNPKDELKTGTLYAMLKQLGLASDEM